MTYQHLGQVKHLTAQLTNQGNVTLLDLSINVQVINPDPEPLRPLQTRTLSFDYVVSQDDLEKGTILLQLTGSAKFGSEDQIIMSTSAQSNYLTLTFDGIDQDPSILQLEVVVKPMLYQRAGESLTYTYHLINISSVTLRGPFIFYDNLLTVASCPQQQLSPLQEVSQSVVYQVTQNDLDRGTIEHMSYGQVSHIMTSAVVETTISAVQVPSILLEVYSGHLEDPLPYEGTLIKYHYTFYNNGNVTLKDLTLNDTNGLFFKKPV